MDLAAAKFGEKRLRTRWERHLDGRDSTHCSIHTQPAREGRINLALPAGARGAVAAVAVVPGGLFCAACRHFDQLQPSDPIAAGYRRAADYIGTLPTFLRHPSLRSRLVYDTADQPGYDGHCGSAG